MIDTELYDRQPPEGKIGRKSALPVLFHLRDVSRPAVRRPVDEIVAPSSAAATTPSETFESAPQFSPPTALAIPLPPAPYASEPAPAASSLDISPILPEPPPAPLELTPSSTAALVEDSDQAATTSTGPSGTEKNTLEVRPARRYKTPPTEEWFATHGKFIAAGFVLALIGTMYLARTTRKSSPSASHPTQSAPLLADAKASANDAAITIDLPTAASSSAVATAKPVAAPEGSQVDLQLPVAAQTEPSPAATAEKTAGSDSLFVFQPNKRTDERVAARNDLVPASANLPSPPPNMPATSPTGTMPAAYPVTNSPALYQEPPSASTSYPRTAAPSLPVAAPPLPSLPPATPAAGSALPPAMQNAYAPPNGPTAINRPAAMPWQPPAGAPPLPGPYQSPDNIARGPRYERTGSGNY